MLLAKELATLDSLSGGRVVAGVGVGWSRDEFANLGVEDRFRVRGAYLDETIALWRHLWSGSERAVPRPVPHDRRLRVRATPEQGAALPIVVGGRAEAALRRAGGLADGYHSSASSPAAFGERVPVIRAAAEAAGRPAPWLSARVRVQFDATTDRYYAMRGTPEEIAAEARAFAGHGVTHLALYFETTDPAEIVAQAERFAGRSPRSSTPEVRCRSRSARTEPIRHLDLNDAVIGDSSSIVR